jgi:mannose-1-phosphate guanylyltransferase
MEAIILCGGLGTRIRTITKDSYPKAMVSISGKTILEWELNWLRKYGISHAVLAVRYLAHYIKDQFGDSLETEYGKIDITFNREKEKLGSGGAVYLAKELISSNEALIMNGDVITNFDLSSMINYHHTQKTVGTIAVAKMRSPFGIVNIYSDDTISEFKEKPILNHWIHAGVNIFQKNVLEKFPKIGQMEDTIFVELAKEKQLKAFYIESHYFWRSIDSPKDLEESVKEWKGL